MVSEQRIVPADTDILCERCGYTLNNLPDTGNCPECGEPIVHSLSQDGRSLSLYELDPRPRTFWQTTFQVIFGTKRFYRTLKGREETGLARRFASRHRWLASILFACCATGHGLWMTEVMGFRNAGFEKGLISGLIGLFVFFLLIVVAHLLLTYITRLAQWLTAIEARYWGIRLPHQVVKRAMLFHSANYLPVAAVAAATITTYQLLRVSRIVSSFYDTWYIYGLCGLVVLCAGYLFQTYWIGMKNLMYSNR